MSKTRLMSKYTPGPWRIAGSTYGERWIVDSESPKTGKQNLIAMLQDHWKGNANGDMDANANLIAAAPLMLEALEMADELIDQLIIDNTDNHAEERAKIRAAIKAAKGEI
jgi:hypothetical protein